MQQSTNDKDEIIVHNFFIVGHNGDKSLRKSDLGWNARLIEEAQTDFPEYIFRYFVDRLGLNLLFYWTKDREWYTIETEKCPVEVRRLHPNPNWDGIIEYQKSDLNGEPHTNSAGELLATFDEPDEIWDNLRIDGVPIGEVLENSLITDLD